MTGVVEAKKGELAVRGSIRAVSFACLAGAALVMAGCASAGGSGSSGGSTEHLNRLTLMVGSAPGGSVDTFTRLLQPGMQKALGTTIVVQNAAGADGNTAAEIALDKGKDCSYLVSVNIPAFLTSAVEEGVPFKSSDFTAMAEVFHDYGDIVVRNDSKWKTMKDLLADAKENPGKISISVQSLDSSNGQGLVDLEKAAGVKFNIVPFGGSGGKARDALIGKQVDANASNVFNGQGIAAQSRVLAVFQPANNWASITDNAPAIDSVVGTHVPDVSTLYGVAAASACKADHPALFKQLENSVLAASKSDQYKTGYEKLGEGGAVASIPDAQFHEAITEEAKLFNVPAMN